MNPCLYTSFIRLVRNTESAQRLLRVRLQAQGTQPIVQKARELGRRQLRDYYAVLAFCRNRQPPRGRFNDRWVRDTATELSGCWYSDWAFSHWLDGRPGYGAANAADWQRDFILEERSIRYRLRAVS